MKKISRFFISGLAFLPVMSMASSTTSEVPGITKFVEIMTNLAGGKVGLFLVVVVLGFSVYNAWKNNNVTALLWGIFAAIVIAVLVPLANAFINWGTKLSL